MKFIRFLCNVGIFILSYVMIFSVGIMSYSVISWGISSDEAIHFVTSDKDKVNFWDGWAFQVTDIGVNITSEPKPYVRNVFGGHGKWADYAVNFVGGVFKPVIVPHAQIDNLAEHRTTSIYEDLTTDYSDTTQNRLDNLKKKYSSRLESYGAFIELATFNVKPEDSKTSEEMKSRYLGVRSVSMTDASIESPQFIEIETRNGKIITASFYMENGNIRYDKIYIYIDGIKVSDDTYAFFTEKGVGGFEKAKSAELFDSVYQYWAIHGNDSLANRVWLSYKYNNPKYDKYVTKFFKVKRTGDANDDYEIIYDGDGKPMIKTEAIVLCVLQWVSLIVAAIFTIRYPITIIQARITARKNKKDSDVGVTL